MGSTRLIIFGGPWSKTPVQDDITWHLVYSSHIQYTHLYSSNISVLSYTPTGTQVKATVSVDTRIYYRSIMSGVDNISVPHPPVRSWSTGTPPDAWIPPGRTSASGSVWTSCWNPVGPSVDVSDNRSAMWTVNGPSSVSHHRRSGRRTSNVTGLDRAYGLALV